MSGKWLRRLALGALPFVALTGLCAPPQPITTGAADVVRIAILLPLRSLTLDSAAEAVRAGIQAAFEREPEGVSLKVIETDGSAADVQGAYAAASASADIIIGPLTRTEVGSVAHQAKIDKPTIALAQPEMDTEHEGSLPPKMLAMGLSIEEEARQVANWAGAAQPGGDAMIISTATPWQRRAAKAFAAQWQTQGRAAQTLELGWSDGFLNSMQVAQLKKRLRADNPAVLFVALDAVQAGQLRNSVGHDIPMYGTSQLNPVARPAPDSTSLSDTDSKTPHSLDGVRLVDIPWQLEIDHPAVMVYPQLRGADDVPLSADQARLYALGIDAYRVAHALTQQGSRFDMDGVTGKLRLRFDADADAARFQRVLQAAEYRNGIVVPLRDGR